MFWKSLAAFSHVHTELPQAGEGRICSQNHPLSVCAQGRWSCEIFVVIASLGYNIKSHIPKETAHKPSKWITCICTSEIICRELIRNNLWRAGFLLYSGDRVTPEKPLVNISSVLPYSCPRSVKPPYQLLNLEKSCGSWLQYTIANFLTSISLRTLTVLLYASGYCLTTVEYKQGQEFSYRDQKPNHLYFMNTIIIFMRSWELN